VQLEVSKGLVKFKSFNTEEEAKAFKLEGKRLGNVTHVNDKWWVSYSKVGEMVMDAAKETSDYYKMNVTLGMDYVIAKNWAGAH